MAEKFSELGLVRIRPAQESDGNVLRVLYERLDTCNGDAAKVKQIIRDSRNSLMSATFDSLTLVAEVLDDELRPGEVAASGRLILLGDGDEDQAPLMYEEAPDGLALTRRSTEPSLEMAGMVTLPKYEGQGIGKALTAVRAIIARSFSGIIGADKILVEFLPEYDDPESKENAFWRDLILGHMCEKGILELAMKHCSDLTGQVVDSPNKLLKILLKADVKTRNQMVSRYFPHSISSDKITFEARQVTGDVGRETKGALINMTKIYGSGTFNRTGFFPVDGGPNYESYVDHGALGDKTVRTAYTDDSVEDAKIMADVPERLVVWTPRPSTQRGLRDSSWIMTPGILGPKVVKLPNMVSNLTNVASGEETSVYKLPLSSTRKS